MRGWKTWAGAAIIAVGAALEFLGYGEFSKLLYGLGGALGLIGVAHKVEKAGGSA